MTKALRIDIVSDVVCPWCIIGYKQVEKALAMLGEAGEPVNATFHWHPFELNPNMVPEGEDSRAHIQRKYGSTPAQSNGARQRLSDAGDALDFPFNFREGARIYNTFKAHILLGWAGADHGQAVQTQLKLALFKAYFQDGRDVSDTAVLLDTVESIGLDRAAAENALADPQFTQSTRSEEKFWVDQGVSGVPAIIIGEKFMVPGAQDATTFANIIRKVLAKGAARDID